jgi:hypothetical protein
MNKTTQLRGIRQTAIIFASLCCTAAAVVISTPVLAASGETIRAGAPRR